MKKLNLFLLGLALFFSLSCSKDKEIVDIDERNLTSCEAQNTCKYSFAESADLELSPLAVKKGDYRLFSMMSSTAASQTKLYIMAPMDAQQFMLNDEVIREGRVKYFFSCPSCDYVALKPAGGYVKGKNLTPEKPANQSKWLIEAKIELVAIADPAIKQTLYIKQYFTPDF